MKQFEDETEELGNLERLMKKAMTDSRKKVFVYEIMNNYEDIYSKIKNPTPKQQNDYINLYFAYMDYSNKK